MWVSPLSCCPSAARCASRKRWKCPAAPTFAHAPSPLLPPPARTHGLRSCISLRSKYFEAIGNAFAVLSDGDKRAHYDRYGEDDGPQVIDCASPLAQNERVCLVMCRPCLQRVFAICWIRESASAGMHASGHLRSQGSNA